MRVTGELIHDQKNHEQKNVLYEMAKKEVGKDIFSGFCLCVHTCGWTRVDDEAQYRAFLMAWCWVTQR